MWLDGVLPSLVPWTSVFHARGAGAAKMRARDAGSSEPGPDVIEAASRGGDEEAEEEEGGDSGSVRYAVRLRGLRHPLLLGDYLKVGLYACYSC